MMTLSGGLECELMNRTRRTVRLIPLGAIAALGIACPDDDDDVAVDTEPTTTVDVTTIVTDTETDTDTEVPEEAAMVRVVHAIAGAPDVAVHLAGEDTPLVPNLAYGEASDYFELPDGENTIELRVPGTGGIPSGVVPGDVLVLATEVIDVAPNQRITTIAAGETAAGGDLRLLVFDEDFANAQPDSARIRVVHAGPDVNTVGIDVGDDGSVEIDGLERFAATDAAGVNLPAGEELQVRLVENDETLTVFTTPELPDGADLFIIATGRMDEVPRGESGFVLLPVGPDGALDRIRQNPQVFALHGSPNAPQIDVCAGDEVLVAGLAFEEDDSIGSFFVRPDEYDVNLQEAGQECMGTPIVEFSTPMLEAGERYLAAVGGNFELIGPGDPQNTLIVAIAQDTFSLDQRDQALIRLLHAAAAPSVVAGLVENGTIADINVFTTDLGPGEQTGELPAFDPSSYTIGLSVDDMSPYDVLVQGNVELSEGERSWIVIAGDAAEQLRFRIVDTAEPRAWSVRDVLLNTP
jgi:hypothetical protein